MPSLVAIGLAVWEPLAAQPGVAPLPHRYDTVIACDKRLDDYRATIAARYRALTLPQVDAALRAALDPAAAVRVVVGDAKVVKPQLDTLGLPVEVVAAASVGDAK